MATAPILALPDFNKEFILYTDASDQAISYILGQKDAQGKEQVIEYGARAIRPSERSWHTTYKEGLALVTGVLHYHIYLADKEFTVCTDHHALKSILDNKNPKGRLSRWTLLQQYRMKVVHKPGKHNTNTDGLSRCDIPQNNPSDDPVDKVPIETTQALEYKLHYQEGSFIELPNVLTTTTKSLSNYQWEDEELLPLKQYLDNETIFYHLVIKKPDQL